MQLNILFQGGSSLQQQQEKLLEEEALQEVHNYSTYLLYCDGTSKPVYKLLL